jgi:hypothetical protein
MYAVSNKESYFNWSFSVLLRLINVVYWVLYSPFLEVFMGIFKCSNGYHKINTRMSCYGGTHITLIVFCMIFNLLLIFIIIFCSLFYTETNPVKENALVRVDDEVELPLIPFRIFSIIYVTFFHNVT